MNNEQDRRAISAIALSMIVFFVWSSYFAPPPVETASIDSVEVLDIQNSVAENSGVEATISADVSDENTNKIDTDNTAVVSKKIKEKSELITTDNWSGAVYSGSGALRKIVLEQYTAPPVVSPLWTWLFSKVSSDSEPADWVPYKWSGDKQQLLSEQGALLLAGVGEIAPDGSPDGATQSEYAVTAMGDTLVATKTTVDGIVITKKYSPSENQHTIDVEVTFDNQSGVRVDKVWVGVVDYMDGEAGRFADAPRPVAHVADSVELVQDLDDLEGSELESFIGPVEWFGVGSRYFMSILIPTDPVNGEIVVDTLSNGQTGSFLLNAAPLDAGGSRTLRYTAFIGPKLFDVLNPLGHKLGEAVDYGWFGFFANILLFLLKMFQAGVTNWGVAIILLTVLVKLVFFPLTQKSFVSSRRMQAIQPELKALKEKYKDNKELQTKETMKLFTDNKVNPMGGCLPMLIQFPVWIALYNVMLNSGELYNAGFLYLQDLTAADPYGVLPTAYAFLMIGQQRMMPMGNMDPAQQKMMRMMPLMFAFFMYSFPSGLVLYFSVNMMLTI